jgi:NAD(P)-dependent dehydrogenase (short-subunit alcohol dehydrogenase family)
MPGSVFLTGASGGLGEGMSRAFARRGYSLALTGRRTDRLEVLAAELRESGSPRVTVLALDVTDFAAVPRVMADAAAQLGGLDIVVANSGIGGSTPIGRGAFEAARRVIETNLLGAMATIDAAVELFLKQGRGHVVGVTSVAAVRGLPMQGAYSASKSGLSRYLEAVRMEAGDKGIVVTDLAPGFIDTEINRHMPSRPFVVSAEKGTEEMVALIESRVGFAYVPRLPWTPLAQLLKVLPSRLLNLTR